MNYLKISDDFIKKYPDYKNHVMNFNEYLEKQWKNSLSDENIRYLIQGLNVEFLLDSLIYNVSEKRKYKSKATAKMYATVIGQLFNYIRKYTDIENPRLYDDISYNRSRENTYMKRMMSYVEGCELLAGSVELTALRQSEVGKILEWADDQLASEQLWKDPTGFRKAMAALGIKMILVYGITYRVLRQIKTEQYDAIRSCITINGFELRLPINLSDQMKRMKLYKFETLDMVDCKYFFSNLNGEQWGEITSSSGIPDYLGTLIENTSITSIVKYGISQLLKAGLSDSIIKKLTGASDKLIQGCISQDDMDIVNIINNKLVTVEMYYDF